MYLSEIQKLSFIKDKIKFLNKIYKINLKETQIKNLYKDKDYYLINDKFTANSYKFILNNKHINSKIDKKYNGEILIEFNDGSIFVYDEKLENTIKNNLKRIGYDSIKI